MKSISKSLSENSFKKMMTTSLILSILMFFVGLVFYLKPDLVSDAIGYIFGAMAIFTGINVIYKFFTRDGARLYSLNLIFGILFFLLGILIMMSPSSVTSFFTVCLGLYLIIHGAVKISYGSWLKVGNDSAWLITIVIGIMLILFGLLLFVNPFANIELTKLYGIFIMLANLLDIADILMIKKRSDEIVKVFW